MTPQFILVYIFLWIYLSLILPRVYCRRSNFIHLKTITFPIIPIHQIFYNAESKQIIPRVHYQKNTLDFPALASFCSLGFMLDDDTFFKEIKTLKPATEYQINDKNEIISEQKIWNWHYSPLERSFENTLDEFSSLFNRLIIDSTKE